MELAWHFVINLVALRSVSLSLSSGTSIKLLCAAIWKCCFGGAGGEICISWKIEAKLKSSLCNQFPRNTTLHSSKSLPVCFGLYIWYAYIEEVEVYPESTHSQWFSTTASLAETSMQKSKVISSHISINGQASVDNEWWWFFLLLFRLLSLSALWNCMLYKNFMLSTLASMSTLSTREFTIKLISKRMKWANERDDDWRLLDLIKKSKWKWNWIGDAWSWNKVELSERERDKSWKLGWGGSGRETQQRVTWQSINSLLAFELVLLLLLLLLRMNGQEEKENENVNKENGECTICCNFTIYVSKLMLSCILAFVWCGVWRWRVLQIKREKVHFHRRVSHIRIHFLSIYFENPPQLSDESEKNFISEIKNIIFNLAEYFVVDFSTLSSPLQSEIDIYFWRLYFASHVLSPVVGYKKNPFLSLSHRSLSLSWRQRILPFLIWQQKWMKFLALDE